MSIFSVVATPIGNLEDITLRALATLRNADVILCEDTRVTRKLLERHGIDRPTLSYHAHSKLSRTEEIIALLRQGKDVALVSDAGTPAISDPGSVLVAELRRRLADEISSGLVKIVTVPGPSALTSALSVSGVPCAEFVFLGFLPHKKGRETLFREICSLKRTYVFYESTHRILKTLDSLVEHMRKEQSADSNHDPDARCGRITVCRELTKIYEEVVGGTAEEVRDHFTEHPEKVRGEFVVIVSEW